MVFMKTFLKSNSAAEGPDPCELARNPRYRKGPDVCFDNNEDVSNIHTCGFFLTGNDGGRLLLISAWFYSVLGFRARKIKSLACLFVCHSSYQ